MRLRRDSPRHAGRAFLVPGTTPPASIPASPTSPRPDDLVPPEMAEEAREHSADPVGWWLARSAGASAGQAAALARSGLSALLAGTVAARAGSATWEEVAEASEEVSPYAYLAAREIGLGHEGAQQAAQANLGAFEAAAARFGTEDVLHALAKGLGPVDYAALRRQASHAEALEAHGTGIAPVDYLLAAISGASHAQILDAVRAGTDLWSFARRRAKAPPPCDRSISLCKDPPKTSS